jgi:outer membrane immunogenic protein
MNKFLLSSVALIALAGQAVAADLPSNQGPPVFIAPAPTFTWTGFYVGVNAGFGGDKFRYPMSLTDSNGTSLGTGQVGITSSGFLGGGQIGYNYQFSSRFVAGLEADIDIADINGTIGANGSLFNGNVPFSLNAGSKLEYLGTVRGRLGYTVTDRFLVYGTGGFAYGGENSYANGSIGGSGGPSFNVSKSASLTGWTAGAGVEYAITNNWTFKTEYLYVDLGNANLLNKTFGVGDNPLTAKIDVKTTESIVRAGLNYKFGWPEPVVARY